MQFHLFLSFPFLLFTTAAVDNEVVVVQNLPAATRTSRRFDVGRLLFLLLAAAIEVRQNLLVIIVDVIACLV